MAAKRDHGLKSYFAGLSLSKERKKAPAENAQGIEAVLKNSWEPKVPNYFLIRAESGAEKIIPNEGIYWAPHHGIWVKIDTLNVSRVYLGAVSSATRRKCAQIFI